MFFIASRSVEETRRLGERLGNLLAPGDVLLLQGPLGAGKTALTQGIALGAGSGDLVTSPTFVLINEYQGRLKLYHVDLYRLEDRSAVRDLDLADATEDGALIVEWPERGEGMLPPDHLHVAIDYDAADPDCRRITLTAMGERSRRFVHALGVQVERAEREQPIKVNG